MWGGPAPGISKVAKVFLKDGYRVIGLNQRFKGLFSETPENSRIKGI